jgi:hypothetical protein
MVELKQKWLRDVATGWMPVAVCTASAIVVVVVWLTLSSSALMAVVGLLASVLLGLAVTILLRTRHRSTSLLETPFLLAHDTEVFDRYRQLSDALLHVSQRGDPIYRDLALEHLDELLAQAQRLAGGTFAFNGTEAWRIVYERLLRSPGLHLYRSVACVRHRDYWQDEPGRKSMAVNFELHDSERLNIERIAIIADELWPAGDVWPSERIRQWLHEQHAHGIWIKFVRESTLKHERDLLADVGIYGSRALGVQELDDACRTVRFTLSFDFEQVSAAEDRWKRLSVYAESYGGYLDRYELPE